MIYSAGPSSPDFDSVNLNLNLSDKRILTLISFHQEVFYQALSGTSSSSQYQISPCSNSRDFHIIMILLIRVFFRREGLLLTEISTHSKTYYKHLLMLGLDRCL